ncbi:MAG: Mur ligase family protein [Acidimicrobiales bacterium]
MLHALVVAAGAVASAAAGLRWLRVAQREHYLSGSASRFAVRWWLGSPLNGVLAFAAGVGVVAGARWPVACLATAVAITAGPMGLGLKGRSSPLAFTRRLRTLAALWALTQAAAIAAGVMAGLGPVVSAAAAVVVPALVDLACALTAPLERRLAGRYVAQAQRRLRRVSPTVVAITGSYGKTSTKGYVAHLIGDGKVVVASPASFNNRAGLARAVNEHLADGTDVFVAEMGTYGRGEIADLCTWIPPDVSVITAIGPVHLERFGTEDAIVKAKSEILVRAPAVVLVTDDPRLAALADQCQLEAKRVWRVSTMRPDADVHVAPARSGAEAASDARRAWEVYARGELVGTTTCDVRPSNLGCAVAAALELGLTPSAIAARLGALPVAAHRLEASPGGPDRCSVIDDTYNSNPAGARVALETLERLGAHCPRRAVVTPGMVELGHRQFEENARFAERAAHIASDLVIVGRTNRRALLAGVARAGVADLNVLAAPNRARAVAWVRQHLGPEDVALYENDLPDHYP